MRRTRVLVFGAIAISTALACSTFGSSSGDSPEPGVDGAPETTIPPDPPGVIPPGTPPPIEAGSDAGASTLCADAHWICDDFDHGGGPGTAGWDPVDLFEGGTVKVSLGTSPPSPPNLLRSDAPAGGRAVLGRTLNVDARGVRCDFSYNSLLKADVETTVAGIHLDGPSSTLGLELHIVNAVSAFIEEYGTAPGDGGTFLTTQNVTIPGGWFKIRFEIAFGVGNKAEVSFDGVTVAQAAPAALGTFPNATTVRAHFGPALYAGGSQESHNTYDDVVCDYY